MSAAKFSIKSLSERHRIKTAFLQLPGSWQEKTEQNCDYRLDGQASGGWLRAKQFTNGTLYLEASSEPLLSLMSSVVGHPMPPHPASGHLLPKGEGVISGNQAKPDGNLNLTGTYAGTDESGKGDYFGPLVIAGVVVDDKTCGILKTLGVMDSKKLTDHNMQTLSQQILQTVGEQAVCVVEIGPKKYNELYDSFKRQGKNLNHLLAWGHAMVIETLLTQNPECQQAVADQFGNERYILSQLKEKGKGIKLYQTHRAEANTGVAAASILARTRFVQKMQRLSSQYGVKLPLGAGGNVKAQAKVFASTHGKEALINVAKLHFKTTQEI